MSKFIQQRLANLRQKLAEVGIDAFLSYFPPDNQYLTGFTGTTSAVVVTENAALFFCDPRYTEQAGTEVNLYQIEEIRNNFLKKTVEFLQSLNVKTAAIDPAVITVAEAEAVRGIYSGELRNMPDAVAGLRIIKDSEEIDLIRHASALAEGALADVIGQLKAGIPEREVAAQLEYEFKKRGASGPSFETIALFGARSSLPHGQPGESSLNVGDIVLIDMGCRRGGYCSDLTRTYVYDRIPGTWFTEIYETTLAAQRAAIAAIKPGIPARDVDAVARKYIADAGFGENFGHGLGHGVGIEIHERPRLNSESDVVLKEGMVVTIEPGIYLPGQGGVRIEDLAVVTQDGCELLSSLPNELKVLN